MEAFWEGFSVFFFLRVFCQFNAIFLLDELDGLCYTAFVYIKTLVVPPSGGYK